MKQICMRAAALAMSLLGASSSAAQPLSTRNDPDIQAIAKDAYIFGYPLVLMYTTMRVTTNVSAPQKDGRAPMNQVGNLFAYAVPPQKDVVAPNVNTLFSSMWLDVSKEPIVIHQPDTHGRYYVMETLDAWTNVIAAPGKRTTGTGAQDIAIVGPSWTGTLPRGITHDYRSPTNNVWIINRIQANGSKDYVVVNALQRAITTTPLSGFGKPYTWPPGAVDSKIDMKTPVAKQVNAMSADAFFSTMAMAMMKNRPLVADSTIVARMAYIGLKPGSAFTMDAKMAADIRDGARQGLEEIQNASKNVGRIENGWMTLKTCGAYATDYLTRAAVASIGLGCNLPQDAFYLTTMVDATDKQLNGAHRYVLHFAAGQEPAANAF
ncbi:MAG TPA: DUF1254 domain-containing protein, partial [Gemmatimonadaceae bacterium]